MNRSGIFAASEKGIISGNGNRGISEDKRQPLILTRDDYKWPFLFLLCFSALGLKFPLAYLLMPVILLNRFKSDRYDFTIMITLLCGGFGITAKNTFGFHLYYLFLGIAIIGIFVYKKDSLVKKIVLLWTLFVIGLLMFAMMSDEQLMIQFGPFTHYIAIIYFIIPMMIFAGRKFELKEFFRRLMPMCLLLCLWYILDCVVVGGWFFIPNTQNPWANSNVVSTFSSPIWTGFFSFPRKYPQGLYLMALAIFPVINYYRLSRLQWIIVFAALATTRTFSFIFAIVATYLFFRGYGKNMIKYILIGIVLFAGLYYIDSFLPYHGESKQSTLRIKSSIDQFYILENVQDEEELAKLGSERMAQILPKMDLLFELNKEWTGFGFLHPEKTTMSKYIIYNPFYIDQSKSEEVAVNVEVTVVQHILYIGFLGLMMVILFYGSICWIIRKLPDSRFFYSVMIVFIIAGVGGFGGLVFSESLVLIALSLSVVLLNNKNKEKTDAITNLYA